jgi:YidC/Oxa1 family membrane protein insertase
MNSSRTTTIGIFLILLVFFGWMIFNQPAPQPPKPAAKHTATSTDSTKPATTPTPATIAPAPATSAVIKADSAVTETSRKIETPLLTGTISSKGGTISSWVMKHYLTWDKKPLDLVDQTTNGKHGDAQLRFVAADGKTVSTASLNFALDTNTPITLKEGDTTKVTLKATIDSSAYITKTFTFTGDDYTVGIEYHLFGMQSKLTGYRYSLETINNMPYAEEHADIESQSARAFIHTAGGTEEIDVTDPNEPLRKSINGTAIYLANRTKYFVQSLMPVSPQLESSEVNGYAKSLANGKIVESYTLTATIPIGNANNDTIRANYYLGPLEYSRVSELQPPLDKTMDFGWSFLVRPISIYLLYPIFMFLHGFIANWGLVIIFFSIIAKLLTYPLSIGQMKSMRKMQTVMPEVNKIKEQYKDDPKKLQEETFKVYRMYGVNPAGGCLPLLLQMPILFALYAVLQNVIELRQAPFMLWITDLSVPDRLIDFGSTAIPLLGNHISGLTILMVITMVIQSLTTVTDERQRKMAYIMPILFMFLFNNLPAGVGLYYFMFNVFGIAQQFYNKKFLPPLDLEKMKEDAKNKKSGGFMAKMQDMEKNAREARQKQSGGQLPPPKKSKKK